MEGHSLVLVGFQGHLSAPRSIIEVRMVSDLVVTEVTGNTLTVGKIRPLPEELRF